MLDQKEQADPVLSGHLRVLSSAMEDLISPEHIRPGLLDKEDAWLGRDGFKLENGAE